MCANSQMSTSPQPLEKEETPVAPPRLSANAETAAQQSFTLVPPPQATRDTENAFTKKNPGAQNETKTAAPVFTAAASSNECPRENSNESPEVENIGSGKSYRRCSHDRESVATTETERQRRDRLAMWQAEKRRSQNRWGSPQRKSYTRFKTSLNWRESSSDFTAYSSPRVKFAISPPPSPRSVTQSDTLQITCSSPRQNSGFAAPESFQADNTPGISTQSPPQSPSPRVADDSVIANRMVLRKTLIDSGTEPFQSTVSTTAQSEKSDIFVFNHAIKSAPKVPLLEDPEFNGKPAVCKLFGCCWELA
eukprot:Gregarina_sp_Poly_1__8660@NODE_515_length_7812_cov_238_903163_g409_i0_p4_GENE_NODE_515_length_7812_cov_238_903163_g409_i0NODE_515_length_7812_cov_238_903163_g409_i0_p4_ORF_typecomplete_len307_score42_65_NODE_515_length_7812_cov_238_903163_g409_i052926212